jgi:hypothetical protein
MPLSEAIMPSAHVATLQQDGTLTVVGTCPISKKEWTLEGISIKGYHQWCGGMLIQEAFPELTASQRELLISGVTDDAWETLHE